MVAIREYYRPTTLDEALTLLRQAPSTALLAGGTHLIPSQSPRVQTVIDLQALGLDELVVEGFRIHVGAMVTLQRLVEAAEVGEFLSKAAELEGPNTYRNAATVGGTIAIGDPRSYLLTALLVLDAEVQLRMPDEARVTLDRLLDAPHKLLDGGLITGVTLLSPDGAPGAAMTHVARTPRDQAIVVVAVRITREGSQCGLVRIALGGVANRPIRAYDAEDQLKGQPFNKKTLDDAVATVISHLNPPSDFKGSSEYRSEMAAVLTRRALKQAWEKLA